MLIGGAVVVVLVVVVLARQRGGEIVEVGRDLKPARPSGLVAGGLAGVQDALREGQKIEAIKRYRELTGLGLKEAKDAVEALPRQPLAPVAATRQDPAMDPEVRRLVQAGELVSAIARYRELTGLGLKESKDAVEALRDSMPG